MMSDDILAHYLYDYYYEPMMEDLVVVPMDYAEIVANLI